MSDYGRRLERLEVIYQAGVTASDTIARLAAVSGLSVGEIEAEAERLQELCGGPCSYERMLAVCADDAGVPVDVIRADAEQLRREVGL